MTCPHHIASMFAVVATLLVGMTMTVPASAQNEAASAAARGDRIINTTLNVLDLDRAIKFFTEGLGMRVKGRRAASSTVTEVSIGYSEEPGRAELMLMHNKNRSAAYAPGEWGRIIIQVSDIAATADRVVKAGGKVVRPPTPIASAPYIVGMMEDPDGHAFEVIQPK